MHDSRKHIPHFFLREYVSSSQQLSLHPRGDVIVCLFHMQHRNKNSTNYCLLCISAAKVLLFFDICKCLGDFFAYFDRFRCNARGTAGLEEENNIAAAEEEFAKFCSLAEREWCMVYSVWCMVNSPLDGGDLLDADGNYGEFAKVGCIEDEDTAGLEHLKIGNTELVIAIPTLLLIPYNDSTSGMNTLNHFAFEHRTIARHMETMIIKDIEHNMRCLPAGKHVAILAIAQQVKPIGDRGGLYQSIFGNHSITGTDKGER